MAEQQQLLMNEQQVIEHSLTGGLKKVYRNYFVADLATEDGQTCLKLVKKGLMVRHVESAKQTGLVYFHVTQAGAEAVGLQLPK